MKNVIRRKNDGHNLDKNSHNDFCGAYKKERDQYPVYAIFFLKTFAPIYTRNSKNIL
jgi:hypothetical protein